MKISLDKSNKKIDIGLIIYMFIFLFEPPFIPKIRGLIYLSLYSFFVFLCRYKASYKKVWKQSGMATWLCELMIFFIYALCTICINAAVIGDTVQLGHYVHTFGRYFILIVSIFFCSTYVILECDRKGYTTEQLIKIVLEAGVIQGVCVVLALLFPNVKKIFSSIMLLSGNDIAEIYSYRGFGFSRNMVDGFGLGTGVIAGLACILGKRDKKYFLLSVFLLVVPLLNSRTGLVIYLVALLFTFIGIILECDILQIIKVFIGAFVCVVLAGEFYQFLSVFKPEVVQWVENGMQGFFLVLQGQEAQSGSMSVLMQDSWWKLPDGIQLFIGSGHTRYEAEGYNHTDVGYVNDLWFVGIVGMVLLYGSIAHLFYKALKNAKRDRLILVFLMVSFIVFNIKTCAISYYPGTAVIFTIIFWSIYRETKKKMMLEKMQS